MSDIRPLIDDEFPAFIEIFANAYPAMLPENFGKEQKLGLSERWSKAQKEPDENKFYGCFNISYMLPGILRKNFLRVASQQPLITCQRKTLDGVIVFNKKDL